MSDFWTVLRFLSWIVLNLSYGAYSIVSEVVQRVVLMMLGFRAGGVAAGSIAAGVQSVVSFNQAQTSTNFVEFILQPHSSLFFRFTELPSQRDRCLQLPNQPAPPGFGHKLWGRW